MDAKYNIYHWSFESFTLILSIYINFGAITDIGINGN